MLKTFQEVEEFLDKNADKLYDNVPKYSIQFGVAEDSKATLHLLEDNKVITVINCFTWNQTRNIRSAFVFGDNHRSRPRTWVNVCMILRDTMRDLVTYSSIPAKE